MKKNSILFAILMMMAMTSWGKDEEFPTSYFTSEFAAHWMSKLPDDTRLCDLSIPTAHDAATWDAWSYMWRDQQFNERKLFDAGVRAFDLRLANDGNYRHGSDHFSNDMQKYEDEQTSYMPTLAQIKGECMILFIQWEKEGGDNDEIIKKGFNDWAEKVVSNSANGYPLDKFVKFRKGLTLGDVRDKILVIENEDDLFNTDNITNKDYKIPTARIGGGYIWDSTLGALEKVKEEDRDGFLKQGSYEDPKFKKKGNVESCFNNWFNNYFTDHVNTSGTINYHMLNSYYYTSSWSKGVEFQNGCMICTDMEDYEDGGIEEGVNHFTYDYLADKHDPYGFVQFDFIGEKSNDFGPSYGDKLLERVIQNNFRGSTAKGKYISDIAVCSYWKTSGQRFDIAIQALASAGYSVFNVNAKDQRANIIPLGRYDVCIGYKLTDDPDEAITNLLIYRTKEANDYPEELTGPDGHKYQRVPICPNGYIDWYGNLNNTESMTDADSIYLYYTKDCTEDPLLSRALMGFHVAKNGQKEDDSAAVGQWSKNADGQMEFTDQANIGEHRKTDTGEDVTSYLYMDVHEHEFLDDYSSISHYKSCQICGRTTDSKPHSMAKAEKCDGYQHYVKCTECNYDYYERCYSDSYDDDGFATCAVCGNICAQPATYSSENSFAISNAGQLYWFASQINKENQFNAILTKDIVISEDVQSKAPWIPIGTYKKNFEEYIDPATGNIIGVLDKRPLPRMFGTGYYGTFDGRGHTISGIRYEGDGKRPGHGLFGFVCQGTVMNLGITDSYFSGFDCVGSVAGRMDGGHVLNVFSTADVDIDFDYQEVGGIVGKFYNTEFNNGFYDGAVDKNLTKYGYCRYALGRSENNNSSLQNFYALYADEAYTKPLVLTEDQFRDGTLLDKLNAGVKSYNESAGEKILVPWSQNVGEDALPLFDTSVERLDYLCFKAGEDGTSIGINYSTGTAPETDPNWQYSFDRVVWKNYTPCVTAMTLEKAGDCVYFRTTGNNTTFSQEKYYHFTSDKSVAASGNIMSLLDGTMQSTTVPDFAFFAFFEGCKTLTSAPELPATTLGYGCYMRMFSGCTGLTVAPALPATTLTENCYYAMFRDCVALKAVKVYFTDWGTGVNEGAGTYYWLSDASLTGTFYYVSGLDVSKRASANHIPERWTAVCMNPDITLNSSGYATFSSASDVQIEGDCAAYTVEIDGNELRCSKVSDGRIPAYTGVLLYGNPGAVATMTLISGVAALMDNDLRPTSTVSGIASVEESFTLSGDAFRKFVGTSYNPDKAYLPKTTFNDSDSKNGFTIVFDGDTPTGIDCVDAELNPDSQLSGKFIRGGHLVILKNGRTYNAYGQNLRP